MLCQIYNPKARALVALKADANIKIKKQPNKNTVNVENISVVCSKKLRFLISLFYFLKQL